MSDRLVFLDDDDESGFEWADVIVKKSATDTEIEAATKAFERMPGPHKVMVTDEKDPRYLKFIDETWIDKSDLSMRVGPLVKL